MTDAPRFFVYNKDGDAVAVGSIIYYEVYPELVKGRVDPKTGDAAEISRPLTVTIYLPGVACHAKGEYAVAWLAYAAPRKAGTL